MPVSKRARGDYQTPEAFAQAICHYLYHDRGLRPVAVLEPTCGLGHLLQASMIFDAQQYIGIELNPEYCSQSPALPSTMPISLAFRPKSCLHQQLLVAPS